MGFTQAHHVSRHKGNPAQEELQAKIECGDREDINPELIIEEVPENAQSLVLIVDDPDAPRGNWTHWVVFNIDPKIKIIKENSVVGIQGMNDFKRVEWGGPCPPDGQHRYFFKLYALDNVLKMGEGSFRSDIEKAMQDHIIAETDVMGVFG